jgi:hypothetical protein
MRRRIITLLAVAALTGLTATVALAASPHFIKNATSATRSGNTLSADFKISGLGLNVTQVDVTLSADAQCVNPGSNKPKAGNKQSFSSGGTFTVRNGTAEGTLDLTATFQPDCTPPMTVEYSNVSLTASVDGVIVATATIPGTF